MKILVGYDGSKAAESVLKLAHKHGLAFDAELHIVTSLEQGPALKKEMIDKADNRLENLKSRFKADNITCEMHTSVSYQSVGEDLINYAENNDIDEIIIGVKIRSKVGKLVFGSTAQYVILKSPCPVLTVK